MDEIRGERKAVDFGSQIRSYVLAPYQMVKDHRTEEEVGDPQRVLDGDLDRFIEAELRRPPPSVTSTAVVPSGSRTATASHCEPERQPDAPRPTDRRGPRGRGT